MSSGLDLSIPVDEDWHASAVPDDHDATVTFGDATTGTEVTLRGDRKRLALLLGDALLDLDGKATPTGDGATQEGVGRAVDITRMGFRPGQSILVAEPGKPTFHKVQGSRVCGADGDCLQIHVLYGRTLRTLHVHPDEELRWITEDRAKELTAEALGVAS